MSSADDQVAARDLVCQKRGCNPDQLRKWHAVRTLYLELSISAVDHLVDGTGLYFAGHLALARKHARIGPFRSVKYLGGKPFRTIDEARAQHALLLKDHIAREINILGFGEETFLLFDNPSSSGSSLAKQETRAERKAIQDKSAKIYAKEYEKAERLVQNIKEILSKARSGKYAEHKRRTTRTQRNDNPLLKRYKSNRAYV